MAGALMPGFAVVELLLRLISTCLDSFQHFPARSQPGRSEEIDRPEIQLRAHLVPAALAEAPRWTPGTAPAMLTYAKASWTLLRVSVLRWVEDTGYASNNPQHLAGRAAHGCTEA